MIPAALSFYDLMERYPDEAAAERYFQERRWPNGVRCPECKTDDVLRGKTKRRRQIWHCKAAECRSQFSVTSGTIMEDTKLPLKKWLYAFHFIGASKKGISSLQLSRMLSVTYKTAWHLSHRIRHAMKTDNQFFSGIIEVDETYVGGKRKYVGRGYRGNKVAVLGIVERNTRKRTGQIQTISLHRERVDGRTVGAKLRIHTNPKKTVLMTDDSAIYDRVGQAFKEHHSVNHSAEQYAYEHPDGHLVSTNQAEGAFANMKRQIVGTHHHTSKRHLPRYLEEYDFKYNTREESDGDRTDAAVRGIEGKKLPLYKTKDGGESLIDRAPPPGPPSRAKRTRKAKRGSHV